ncbi:MAG: hypothetical protein JW797_14455 [Bradymonadales bacterium]|nr:hypothetical protein [Bradymonadales bacterium]
MNANGWRATGPALVILIALTLYAQSVWALNQDDILRLHEAGLNAGTIVNVIRGTTEPIEITPEEIDELEATGVPAEVITELRSVLGVQTQPQQPAVTSPPTDQQQQLEQERLRIEQERMEAERERLRQQIEAEEARATTVETEFRALRNARSLLRDGRHFEAAAMFHRFIEEVQPDPMSDEYYDATFGLVDALHQAGLRWAIREEALQVALMGSSRRHFSRVVPILQDIVRDVGFRSPRITDLANQIIREYDADFQDVYNFFLGRYFFDAGELNQALTFLSNVDSQGEYGARALFLTAVILLNPQMGENIRGVETLQRAIMVADPDVEVDREVIENAYLALARVAYQVGNFGGALYYYNKIPVSSQRWTSALFESGWTYFLFGDMNRAIGNFHSLHSPYHQQRFYPDLYVLEAAAYLYTCNIDAALEAVSTFEEEIGSLRNAMRQFMVDATDPMVFERALFDQAQAARQGQALPPEALSVVLSSTDFHNLFQIISQFEQEIALFRPMASQFGSWGENVLSDLETTLANRRIEAGILIHDTLQEFIRELDDWWFRAQEVKIDIGDLQARYLELILSEGRSTISEGSTLVIVAADWQYWPWEGEYWLDEVGSYRGNLTTRCPDDVQF